MSRLFFAILTVLSLGAVVAFAVTNDPQQPHPVPVPILITAPIDIQPAQQNATGDGLALWDKIHSVFSHPRCSNCHVGSDNVPRWQGAHYAAYFGTPDAYALDDGTIAPPHGMNINAGDSRTGLETIECTTCHAPHNSEVPHGPPGAHVWALAPLEMEWLGKTSAEICEQIKDPARTGGRDLGAIADHIDHDALVHWGWNPGPGREPAPFSKDEMVQFITQWAEAGAPCPT